MSVYQKMSAEEHEAIESLRNKGFAVVIMNPEECGDIDPSDLESWMAKEGNNFVDLQGVEEE